MTAALKTVRPHGRIVLMGGIRTDLPISYAWLMRDGITLRGQWMYARESIGRLVALLRSGSLALDATTVTTFALDKANEAVAHAGAFATTVICP